MQWDCSIARYVCHHGVAAKRRCEVDDATTALLIQFLQKGYTGFGETSNSDNVGRKGLLVCITESLFSSDLAIQCDTGTVLRKVSMKFRGRFQKGETTDDSPLGCPKVHHPVRS